MFCRTLSMAVPDGVRPSSWTATVYGSMKNGRKKAKGRHLRVRRRRKTVFSLRCLAARSRKQRKRRRKALEDCHLNHDIENSSRTLTIAGPDFPSWKNVPSTAWHTSNLQIREGHSIPKSSSATLCTAILRRYSRCTRR